MRRALVLLSLAACDNSGDLSPPPGPGVGDDGCTAPPAAATGRATYYAADGRGNCSFDATPHDLYVAAINGTDYGVAAWCGGCVEVTGPTGTVIVRIVDSCGGCARGDLDLSERAFAEISPLSAGRVPIRWRGVACDVTGPVRYRFKEGSNPFWTAIQVRDHRYPIADLAARPDGSDAAWRSIARVDYNYFVTSAGLGSGPYELRLRDTRGHERIDRGIELGDGEVRTGSDQLPLCADDP